MAKAQEDTQTAAPLPAVGFVVAEMRDVTPSVEFVGRIEAVSSVDLRARVTGFLKEQRFEDGAMVSTGDVLFVIEQEPFAAQVQQAEADLAAAKATAENAAIALERAEELLESETVAQATVDDRSAEKRVAEASVLQAEAALEQAKITYSYTEITAPIDGRIGRAAITLGNLVSPESGVLTTIVHQDPVYATFNISEKQWLETRREVEAAGESMEDGDELVRIRLQLSDGTVYDHPGEFNFADVQVNPTTDTILLRGLVPNPDGLLVDQQFVVVIVETAEPERRLVVPESAISVDQRGRFVLIVNDQNMVEERFIQIGESEAGQAVITSGLEEGDRVIVDGIMKVRNGMEVDAVAAQTLGN
ncbi:MAG: efflux RND transporter periplasmic adaptor subunit [Pseudomonadota bacterium]